MSLNWTQRYRLLSVFNLPTVSETAIFDETHSVRGFLVYKKTTPRKKERLFFLVGRKET